MRFHIGWFNLVYCLIFLAIVLAGLSIFIDSDSTKGRLLIYKISGLIWQDHFLTGIGPNRFQAIYNTYQASYFSSGKNSPQELMFADNTFYAFNDYFQFAIEYGIIGIIVLLSYFMCLIKLVQHLIRNNKGELKSVVFVTTQLIAISFTACFTHIFERPIAWCALLSTILILLIIASNVKIYKQYIIPLVITLSIVVISTCNWDYIINKKAYQDWEDAEKLSKIGAKSASLEFYNKGYEKLKYQHSFLLSYGNTLKELHHFDSALIIYNQASLLQCSHLLLDNIAACHQSLGNNEQAEAFYLRSIFTVPNRFTTRYHLFNFYMATNQMDKASICGYSILNLPIKIPSVKIDEIRTNVTKKLMAIFLHEVKAIFVYLKNT